MNSAELLITNHHVIQIQGELNFFSVKKLWEKSRLAILKISPRVRIDLSNVTHCDSAGLALLTEWQRLATQTNRSISFENLPTQLLNIAKVSSLNNILNIQ